MKSQTDLIKKSKKIIAEEGVFEFCMVAIEQSFVFSLKLISFISALAIPIQLCAQSLYWIKTGVWLDVTWLIFMDKSTIAGLLSSEFVGLNIIIEYVLDSWISIPITIAGLFLSPIFSAIADGRNTNSAGDGQ